VWLNVPDFLNLLNDSMAQAWLRAMLNKPLFLTNSDDGFAAT